MRALDSLELHNPIYQNKVWPACKFCVQLIFLYHDGATQYEGLLSRSFLRLIPKSISALRELLDAAVQNLNSWFWCACSFCFLVCLILFFLNILRTFPRTLKVKVSIVLGKLNRLVNNFLMFSAIPNFFMSC